MPSTAPEARIVPSGEYATEVITSICPSNVTILCLVAISHSLMVFHNPEASVLPSGENAMFSETILFRTAIFCFVAISHNLTLLSLALEASSTPSDENAMEMTPSV